MTFFDRIGKFLDSVDEPIKAPFGLVADLATAGFDDDEYEGFIGNVFGEPLAAFSKAAGRVTAPVGAAASLLYLDKALAGSQWLYNEGVSQPLSTAITVGSLGSSDEYAKRTGRDDMQPWDFFRGSIWKDAYNIAEHRSPGQSVYIGTKADDILDPAEVEKAQKSPAYHFATGIIDAAAVLGLDPVSAAGKGYSTARKAAVVNPLRKADDIETYVKASNYHRFREWAMGKSAAEIHSNKAIKSNTHGAAIASLYSQARTPQEFDQITRVSLGDLSAIDELKDQSAGLQAQITRALSSNSEDLAMAVRDKASGGQANLFADPARVAAVRAEVGDLSQRDEALQRILSTQGSMQRSRPGTGLGAKGASMQNKLADMRYGWREQIYHKSPYATAVRVLTWAPNQLRQAPTGWIDLNRAESHNELNSMLHEVPDMSPEMRLSYVNKYMNARTEADRMAVVQSAEQRAIKMTLTKYGLEDMTADQVASKTLGKKQAMRTALKTRSYSGAQIDTPEGAKIFADEFLLDEDSALTKMPILETELANMLPLTDIKRLGQMAKRHENSFRALMGTGHDVFSDGMDIFNQMWKFSVLMRLGYPARVVADDQLRIIAKLGAMTELTNLKEGVKNFVWNRRHYGKFSAGEDAMRIGNGTIKIGDLEAPAAFAGDHGDVYRQLSSSAPDWMREMTLKEQNLYKKITGSGNYQPIAPETDEVQHLSAWMDSINKHIKKSEIAKQFLAGKTRDEVANWLTTDKVGRGLRSRMKWAGSDPEGWAYRVGSMVDQYLPQGLADIAKERNVTVDDLKAVGFHDRPVVHGELLQHNLGAGAAAQVMDGVMEKGMKLLGQLPTDTLSRQPLFSALYKQRMKEMHDIYLPQIGDEGWAPDLVESMARQSREYALTETRKVLFDVASRSNAAETMRFMAPFFSAWQETLTTWAGLSRENPAILARAGILWSSPNRAGLIYDRDTGEKVGPDAGIDDKQQFMFQLPEWMPGPLESRKASIPKGALNLALQGDPWYLPGAGPVVQVPVNKIVSNNPQLSEQAVVKWALPFGPAPDTADLVLPTVLKRARSLYKGEEDSAYRDAFALIHQTAITDYRTGKRGTAPTLEESKKKTDSLFRLRIFANLTMPFSPSFTTPYKFYLDQYHNLRQSNARTADEEFYKRYGEDYFAFALSVSKNNTGMPASIRAVKEGKKFKDLLAKYPDKGGIIVGPESDMNGEWGPGEQAAYKYQMTHRVGPGSSEKFREKQDVREVVLDNQARQGWVEYRAVMNYLESERVRLGLNSMRESGGEDLQRMKMQFIEGLGKQNPAWFEAYGQRDENKTLIDLRELADIARDKRMLRNSDRTDLQSLVAYLGVRQQFSDALQERSSYGGAKTINAEDNRDLAEQWYAIVGRLIEQDTKFGDLYSRYLERDDLRPL